MSHNYVKIKDRSTIDSEIIEQIQQFIPQDKTRLIALYFYYTNKKQLDQQIENEIKEIKDEFFEKSLSIQKDINDLIYGIRAPQEAELKEIDQYLNEEERQKKSEINQHLTSEPLAGYWYKSIKQCPMLKYDILERDEAVLKYLHQIEYKKEPKELNFELVFHFTENDYFTNQVLSKRFIMTAEDMPIRSERNEDIKWLEGKDVTKITKKQVQKNKKTGAKRIISREIEDASFFSFFDNIRLDSQQFKLMTEIEKGKMIEKMNIQYDIARILIDEVMPYSLEYYLGLRGRIVDEDFEKQDDDKDDKIEEDDKLAKEKEKEKEKEKKEEQLKKEQQSECNQQ